MKQRLAFIDWMKAVGMLLIVWGHTAASVRLVPLDPVTPKQVGVAFFVFVTGFTLATEGRSSAYVLFSRLFPVVLYGISFTLLLSAIGLWRVGDLAESNYMPFVLGANVLMDDFPANPPTWYIGLYIHLLLLWTLSRRWLRVGWLFLCIWCLASVFLRAAAIELAGHKIAYMLLANWLGVFFLGLLVGRKFREAPGNPATDTSGLVVVGTLGTVLVVLCPACARAFSFRQEFPFPIAELGSKWQSLLFTSLLVELIYLGSVLVGFRAALWLPRSRFIEFLSRNTLPVFIMHMPAMYLTHYLWGSLSGGYLRLFVSFLLYYLFLAVVGEMIGQLVRRVDIQGRALTQLKRLRVFALQLE